jgi:ketosteroid isomerase-like protein
MNKFFGAFLIPIVIGTAAFGAGQGGAENSVLKAEQELAQAGVKQDLQAFQRLEADDYVFTGSDGESWGKERDVADLKSGNFTASEIKLEDMQVKPYGDVAVVHGRATLTNAKYGGADISGPYRFTDVWVQRGGKWELVSSHISRIAAKQ